jgi:hypothetical protein
MARRLLPTAVFLFVFGATLTWRVYSQTNDCCPNNQFVNTYSSCAKHPAEQCGSGNYCLVCNCATYFRVTVGAPCPNAGAHDFGSGHDATQWCSTHETGSCYTSCINSEQALTQTPSPQDNSCVHPGPPCLKAECDGACYSS